jgi:hypothetical protein
MTRDVCRGLGNYWRGKVDFAPSKSSQGSRYRGCALAGSVTGAASAGRSPSVASLTGAEYAMAKGLCERERRHDQVMAAQLRGAFESERPSVL